MHPEPPARTPAQTLLNSEVQRWSSMSSLLAKDVLVARSARITVMHGRDIHLPSCTTHQLIVLCLQRGLLL